MPERPEADEYQPYHAAYIGLVPEDNIVSVLLTQMDEIEALVAGISAEQESHRYAPGKWSVRQVFGHLADAERVFGYRALCLARGQTEPLPPFDENLFVETALFDRRPVAVRRALPGPGPGSWPATYAIILRCSMSDMG